MTYDSRVRPHHIRPAAPNGELVDPGVYGVEVVEGGPFGKRVGGLVPAVSGLTSDDNSVTISDNGDGTIDLAATGGGGGGPKTAVFKVSGLLATGAGATRLYNDTGAAWTIYSIRASVETPPSGGTVVIDVNVSGTTVFTTQANRPTIAAGATTSGKVTSMDVTTVPDGDYLTVDVDSFTSPAANLTATLVYS